MASQKKIKYHKYATNSTGLGDITTPGPNLLEALRAWFGAAEARVVPVIVGCTGETLAGDFAEVRDALELKSLTANDLFERMERSAVLGTVRIVKSHFGGSGPAHG